MRRPPGAYGSPIPGFGLVTALYLIVLFRFNRISPLAHERSVHHLDQAVSDHSARWNVATTGRLFTVTVSLIVIRTQSAALWGEVVPLMLILEFGFTIIGWGVLPHLVQQFSLHPHTMKSDWSQSVTSRCVVVGIPDHHWFCHNPGN